MPVGRSLEGLAGGMQLQHQFKPLWTAGTSTNKSPYVLKNYCTPLPGVLTALGPVLESAVVNRFKNGKNGVTSKGIFWLDEVITTGVFIQIDSAIRRFVSRILRKLVMERLEWSRDDRLPTPRAVASAVSTEMFFVWFVREIAEIEMRVSTGRTVYAAHLPV